jgi:pimeloyl-ACP methyl ester carboxylesterase
MSTSKPNLRARNPSRCIREWVSNRVILNLLLEDESRIRPRDEHEIGLAADDSAGPGLYLSCCGIHHVFRRTEGVIVMKAKRIFNPKRIVALLVIGVVLSGLTYIRFAPGGAAISVPAGARAGELTMHSCTYATEKGAMPADCGTLVVPENRGSSKSRLIALPVIRILARSSHPLAPIFYLNGGPGRTNMTFPQANRLAADHDVVMVGYRGVDGSSVLNCPEVTAALESSADLLGKASLTAYSEAFAACAKRLERSGVDLAGYTLAEQADDINAARVALDYKRIDLLSESAGTRLGMIYQWRYPKTVDRSVMVGVNPPGNFVYSGAEIDQGIEAYSALCAKQPACRARTGNLAASVQRTAKDIPKSWLSLPIKPGNVLVGTFLGLTEATGVDTPLSGPMTLDSWISAAQGDPSGLWLLSTMAQLVLPQSFVWGEFASIGMADAKPVERYYSSGADKGSIIGNPLANFIWGAGGLVHAWPANPGENQYTSVQNSSVPTLLVGGTLDFETPAQNATKELLPHLSNGHQVILSGLGHADDFFAYEPSASTQLLTTFYATGQVDTSRYTPNMVSFTPSPTQAGIAKDILATMVGFALLAVIWLLVLAIRIRRRGGTGRKTGAWIRSAGTIVFGLGGWILGALFVLRFWPSSPLVDPLLTVSVAVAIWLGVYAGWVSTDTPKAMRAKGIGAAGVGAVVGAALDFHVVSGLMALITAIIGAAVVSNLSLLVLDIWTERAARRGTAAPAEHLAAPVVDLSEIEHLEPALH